VKVIKFVPNQIDMIKGITINSVMIIMLGAANRKNVLRVMLASSSYDLAKMPLERGKYEG
jgi:hypothetical protein